MKWQQSSRQLQRVRERWVDCDTIECSENGSEGRVYRKLERYVDFVHLCGGLGLLASMFIGKQTLAAPEPANTKTRDNSDLELQILKPN